VLKLKDIIGKPVIADDSGEKIETVVAPIFVRVTSALPNRDENHLLGFLVDQGGWFSNPKVLPLYLVKSIEADAIIVPWKDSIAPASNYATIHDVLEQNNSLNSAYVLTNNDLDLTTLLDLYFDKKINHEAIELSTIGSFE
jgi:uncharacterized protein YrrD